MAAGRSSLADICLDAANGDPLLAVDYAVTVIEERRRRSGSKATIPPRVAVEPGPGDPRDRGALPLLRLLSRGATLSEAADELRIERSTARERLRAFQRLHGLKSRPSAAVAFALRSGMID